jgi:hypothetical protein
MLSSLLLLVAGVAAESLGPGFSPSFQTNSILAETQNEARKDRVSLITFLTAAANGTADRGQRNNDPYDNYLSQGTDKLKDFNHRDVFDDFLRYGLDRNKQVNHRPKPPRQSLAGKMFGHIYTGVQRTRAIRWFNKKFQKYRRGSLFDNWRKILRSKLNYWWTITRQLKRPGSMTRHMRKTLRLRKQQITEQLFKWGIILSYPFERWGKRVVGGVKKLKIPAMTAAASQQATAWSQRLMANSQQYLSTLVSDSERAVKDISRRLYVYPPAYNHRL